MTWFCLVASILIAISTAVPLESEFEHSAWLDGGEIFKLHWTVDHQKKSITFAAEVKATGWVGFGIAKGLTGTMKGSDIIIGWVDDSGKGQLKDYHGIGRKKPILDKKQDYQLLSASRNNTATILKFRRNLNTCDKEDNSINTVTTKVLFAWSATKISGADDSQLSYHGILNRGSRSLNLLNYVKNSIKAPADAKHFDLLQRNVTVPAVQTTYWCTPFRLSDVVKLNSTKHVIQISPLIQPRAEGLVHHMLIYGCNNDFDPAHLNVSGHCYQGFMPKSIRDCAGNSAIYGWAIGGVSFVFPKDVGYPIGGVNDYKYLLLETHFDNPTKRSDFIDTSGLRLHYTEPRKYDSATLTTGHLVAGNMLIPPKQNDWVTTGVCTTKCSQKIKGKMAEKGDTLNIFASFPHAHTAGQSIRTVQVRNGVALDDVIRDDNYDFDFQQTYVLNKFLKFKAGDELFTFCHYNTSKRKYATVGGLGTTDEMCLNFIMYYPRVNLTSCASVEYSSYYFIQKYAQPKWRPGFNRSAPWTWPRENWNGVEWNSTMMRELKQHLNYSGKGAIGENCLGFGAYDYVSD
eukprot:gene20379-22388_t